jgi:hypothetical protein
LPFRFAADPPSPRLDRTGTLESGKAADVVIWDRTPLSIYATAEKVFIDGSLVFDRSETVPAWSDFNIGSDVEEVLP